VLHETPWLRATGSRIEMSLAYAAMAACSSGSSGRALATRHQLSTSGERSSCGWPKIDGLTERPSIGCP